MAGASLLTLLDDIASVLDDVATMTKVATKKTAGVLGDDLALNAQQVTGVKADRELPVVWAVAKGSVVNKAILVPAALAISFLISWAVTPLLMLGGAFLCFEGFEKLAHKAHPQEPTAARVDPALDPVAVEKDKVKGAVRTDFILSAEIIVIALGTVSEATFGRQVAVLVAIAAIMTVGVYGLVAGIVKLDDAGLWLSQRASALSKALGRGILIAAPWLMKFLSIAGTAAMFMVGGGILVHGFHSAAELIHSAEQAAGSVPAVGGLLEGLTAPVLNGVAGIIAGGLVLLVVTGVKKVIGKGSAASAA